MVVLNQTRTAVRDVVISATDSGRVFSWGDFAPLGICANKFSPQPYQGSPIQISWVVGSGPRRSKTITLESATGFDPELPLRGVLVIAGQTSISTYLQQEVPGRRP